MVQSAPSRLTYFPMSATTSEAPSRASKVVARWTALPGEVVDGGEIVLLAIKPSMWRPVFDSAPWLVTCCVLAVVLMWLGRPLPGWSLATTAQVIMLIALARIGLAVVRWAPTWHVLTNRRIIDIHGVRRPKISSCPLLQIRNSYLRYPPAERATQLGTIIFVTDHVEKVPHVWQSIAKPDEVHAKIRRAIENAIDNHGIGL